MLESWIGPQTMTLVQAYVYQPDAEETMPPFVGLIQADIMLETICDGDHMLFGHAAAQSPLLSSLNRKASDFLQTIRCLSLVLGMHLGATLLVERNISLFLLVYKMRHFRSCKAWQILCQDNRGRDSRGQGLAVKSCSKVQYSGYWLSNSRGGFQAVA